MSQAPPMPFTPDALDAALADAVRGYSAAQPPPPVPAPRAPAPSPMPSPASAAAPPPVPSETPSAFSGSPPQPDPLDAALSDALSGRPAAFMRGIGTDPASGYALQQIRDVEPESWFTRNISRPAASAFTGAVHATQAHLGLPVGASRFDTAIGGKGAERFLAPGATQEGLPAEAARTVGGLAGSALDPATVAGMAVAGPAGRAVGAEAAPAIAALVESIGARAGPTVAAAARRVLASVTGGAGGGAAFGGTQKASEIALSDPGRFLSDPEGVRDEILAAGGAGAEVGAGFGAVHGVLPAREVPRGTPPDVKATPTPPPESIGNGPKLSIAPPAPEPGVSVTGNTVRYVKADGSGSFEMKVRGSDGLRTAIELANEHARADRVSQAPPGIKKVANEAQEPPHAQPNPQAGPLHGGVRQEPRGDEGRVPAPEGRPGVPRGGPGEEEGGAAAVAEGGVREPGAAPEAQSAAGAEGVGTGLSNRAPESPTLTRAYRHDGIIFLSFDGSGPVPDAAALSAEIRRRGYDFAEVVKFGTDIISGTQGNVGYRIDLAPARGRKSYELAADLFRELTGGDVSVNNPSRFEQMGTVGQRFKAAHAAWGNAEFGAEKVSRPAELPPIPPSPSLRAMLLPPLRELARAHGLDDAGGKGAVVDRLIAERGKAARAKAAESAGVQAPADRGAALPAGSEPLTLGEVPRHPQEAQGGNGVAGEAKGIVGHRAPPESQNDTLPAQGAPREVGTAARRNGPDRLGDGAADTRAAAPGRGGEQPGGAAADGLRPAKPRKPPAPREPRKALDPGTRFPRPGEFSRPDIERRIVAAAEGVPDDSRAADAHELAGGEDTAGGMFTWAPGKGGKMPGELRDLLEGQPLSVRRLFKKAVPKTERGATGQAGFEEALGNLGAARILAEAQRVAGGKPGAVRRALDLVERGAPVGPEAHFLGFLHSLLPEKAGERPQFGVLDRPHELPDGTSLEIGGRPFAVVHESEQRLLVEQAPDLDPDAEIGRGEVLAVDLRHLESLPVDRGTLNRGGEAAGPAGEVPETAKFAKPIRGKNGNSIVGYEWRHTKGEKWSNREGGLVNAKVSDWERAAKSELSGRDIVHTYYVKDANGRLSIQGIQSAQTMLGLTESRLRTIAEKEVAEREYRAAQDRSEVKVRESVAKASPEEATADFRERNRYSLQNFPENFGNSVVLGKEGKYVRVMRGGERSAEQLMKARGWSESPKPVGTEQIGQREGVFGQRVVDANTGAQRGMFGDMAPQAPEQIVRDPGESERDYKARVANLTSPDPTQMGMFGDGAPKAAPAAEDTGYGAPGEAMGAAAGASFGTGPGLLRAIAHGAGGAVQRLRLALAGVDLPAAERASPELAQKLAVYASSGIEAQKAIAAHQIAAVMPGRFASEAARRKFGNALIEGQLMGLRGTLLKAGKAAEAAKVGTTLGHRDSPFPDAAALRAYVMSPEAQGDFKRWKEGPQAETTGHHVRLGGKLRAGFPEGWGEASGAFVNMEAVPEKPAAKPVGAATPRGDQTATLKRGSRHSRTFTGTADVYETDAQTLLEKMYANYPENAKRDAIEAAVKSGAAAQRSTIQGRPEGPQWAAAVKVPVDIKGVPRFDAEGEIVGAKTHRVDLWFKDGKVARDFRNAFATDLTERPHRATALITGLQLAAPTDAVAHGSNWAMVLGGIPEGRAGFSGAAWDVLRQTPGLDLADAGVRFIESARHAVADDAAFREAHAKLFRIGAARAGLPEPATALGKKVARVNPLRRIGEGMHAGDAAVRAALLRVGGFAQENGLMAPGEAELRKFITSTLGNYNPRMMGAGQRAARAFGLSPFIVAGRNFNRYALRRVLQMPAYKAADHAGRARLVANAMVGTAVSLALPSLINYARTGAAAPFGIPVGALYIKTKDDGTVVYYDPQRFTGLRRGARALGIEAGSKKLREGGGFSAAAWDAAWQAGSTAIHPWTGPAVEFGVEATTGRDTGGYPVGKDLHGKGGGGAQFRERVTAALEEVNPILKYLTDGRHPGFREKALEYAKALGRSLGYGEQSPRKRR